MTHLVGHVSSSLGEGSDALAEDEEGRVDADCLTRALTGHLGLLELLAAGKIDEGELRGDQALRPEVAALATLRDWGAKDDERRRENVMDGGRAGGGRHVTDGGNVCGEMWGDHTPG